MEGGREQAFTLYLGNLPPSITPDQLRELFAEYQSCPTELRGFRGAPGCLSSGT